MDLWADPQGEHLAAFHAGEVYRLLVRHGFTSEASPPVDRVLADGHLGHHNRAGGHSVERSDWSRFLEFAEKHLKNP